MKRTELRRRTRMKNARNPLKRFREIPKRNNKRLRKLRAQQFGTDGYREHIIATPCLATGRTPSDPAHVLGTRAAGHGPEGMAPLSRAVHRAFDSSMTDERFAARYGITRAEIRQWARDNRRLWQARYLP